MSVAAPVLALDRSFARELPGLCAPWQAAVAPAPRLLALNAPLARELGLDSEALRTSVGVDVLVGNAVPEGATPVAQAYAGHQFGGYSPRLGDGRALLLGELLTPDGQRRDLQLKGSGRTPFARGGDGKAAVGPMLRELIVGEAMHALGIPTTRALAVVATGEDVVRETLLPGAVLTRVAASHLRVGTFEYTAALGDRALLAELTDHAIARHHPAAADAPEPALAFFEAVVEVQAQLVARWMHVGFVHGVMNTDNMTISGETIDYGPCAFMDAYDAGTVFSSIDHLRRYAYGNQPPIAQWNLARLAEALLPLIADDQEAAIAAATTVLQTFPDRYGRHWTAGMLVKLGLGDVAPRDPALLADLPALLQASAVDHTGFFRDLASGDPATPRTRFDDPGAFDAWAGRWQAELAAQGRDAPGVAARMQQVNPVYVPRNHLVEEALAAATAGDLGPVHELVAVVRAPFDERPGLERYAEAAPEAFGAGYRTFCGT
jgi:uncharacterized protein YdiU (UPF0061 family)